MKERISHGFASPKRIPLAKTPTVQILSISNVSSDILEAIDEIAARQDRSRSSFIRRELRRVVAEYQAKEAPGVSRGHGGGKRGGRKKR
jgi:predicted transcriptional regulator